MIELLIGLAARVLFLVLLLVALYGVGIVAVAIASFGKVRDAIFDDEGIPNDVWKHHRLAYPRGQVRYDRSSATTVLGLILIVVCWILAFGVP